MDIKENNIVLFQGKPVCVGKIVKEGDKTTVMIASKEAPLAICMHIVSPESLSEYICPEINGPCNFTREPSCLDKEITCTLCRVNRVKENESKR